MFFYFTRKEVLDLKKWIIGAIVTAASLVTTIIIAKKESNSSDVTDVE
jgi:hypothetical protein